MKLVQRFFLTAVFAALSVSVFAAGVVGTWHGKVLIDSSKLPPAKTPEQQRNMAMALNMVKQVQITMNFKADKTYTASAKGGMIRKQDQSDSGTWSQSGNIVTITPKKKMATQKQKSENLVMSADGRTMTVTIPSGGFGGKVVFTK